MGKTLSQSASASCSRCRHGAGACHRRCRGDQADPEDDRRPHAADRGQEEVGEEEAGQEEAGQEEEGEEAEEEEGQEGEKEEEGEEAQEEEEAQEGEEEEGEVRWRQAQEGPAQEQGFGCGGEEACGEAEGGWQGDLQGPHAQPGARHYPGQGDWRQDDHVQDDQGALQAREVSAHPRVRVAVGVAGASALRRLASTTDRATWHGGAALLKRQLLRELR